MENETQALAGKTILLVEDDLLFTKVIEEHMVGTGATFLHAKDGEASLAVLEKETPDAILLDILLPGIDGFSVLEKIKANDRLNKIPVIVLSNLGQLADIEKGMSLGAYRYLVKASIVPDEVVGHVVSAIDSIVR